MSKRNRVKAKLRLYPDPILKAVCEPVRDDEDVSDIIRDMMHILTNSKTGVGLAAPQAGHTKRVIVVKLGNFIYQVMINPEITTFTADWVLGHECCLSYPGRAAKIKRMQWVGIKWTAQDGIEREDDFYDFDARIIQHEIDHLDGKCKIGERHE